MDLMSSSFEAFLERKEKLVREFFELKELEELLFDRCLLSSCDEASSDTELLLRKYPQAKAARSERNQKLTRKLLFLIMLIKIRMNDIPPD